MTSWTAPGSAAARIADRYGRFYPPIAVVVVVLAFLPLYRDVVVHYGDGVTMTASYGSVFEMAGQDHGGPAVAGILLLVLLVIMLAASTFRGTSAVAPGVTAAVAALLAVMVLARPGTGSPAPALTDAGTAGVALAVCTAVLAFAHAVHVARLRRADQFASTAAGRPGTRP